MRVLRKLGFAAILLTFAANYSASAGAVRSPDCQMETGWVNENSSCDDFTDACCGEDFPDATCSFDDCNILMPNGNLCATAYVWCQPIVCCD